MMHLVMLQDNFNHYVEHSVEVTIYFNHFLQIGDKMIHSLLACNKALSSLCGNRQKMKKNSAFVASYDILIPYLVSINPFTNYIDLVKQKQFNEVFKC